MPEEYCGQHIEFVKQIQEVTSSVKSAHHRIDAIESDNKILHEMNANIKVLATNYENQGREINEIKSDVKILKEKPGKRWDAVVIGIISAITGGIIGIIISQFAGK